MKFNYLFFLLACCLINHSVFGETTTTLPLYRCQRTLDTILIDGKFHEKTWQSMQTVRLGLWNGQGRPGKQTLVSLAWDNDHLYLAYQVEDEQIIAEHGGRDENIFDYEVVEWFVDPSNQRKTYYEFEWNGRGAGLDLAVTYPNGKRTGNFQWNTQMRWAVAATETVVNGRPVKGWNCEVAIPFKDLKGPVNSRPRINEIWAMNLYRIEMTTVQEKEHQAWSPVYGGGVNFHRPQCFGRLVFVE